MRVLLAGAGGLVGSELQSSSPPGVVLAALDHQALDITDAGQVDAAVDRETPDLVINAAAYTAVDRAESDSDRAREVNEDGAANLARAAQRVAARIVHISTDFVFSGRQGHPYAASDETDPVGVYGLTKRDGERRVIEIAGGSAVVLRTAWLYGRGGTNFVTRMLELLGGRDRVEAAVDQIGAPTWVRGLAAAIWAAATHPEVAGVHQWTDAGVASRYDLAVAIQEEALALGLLEQAVPIEPVPAKRFPAPAARPAYSVMELLPTRQALGLESVHWRRQLRSMLAEMRDV